MSDVDLDSKSLEGLLRDRARKALWQEADRVVKALIMLIGDSTRMKIETSGRDHLVPLIEPKGAGYVITLNLRELVMLTVPHIVRSHEKVRGDWEVAEFLRRVENVAEEINDLRAGAAS